MGTESPILVRKRPLSFFPGSLPYTKSSQASPTRNLMNAFLPRILQKKRSSFLTVKMKPSTAQLNNHTTLLPAISSTSIPEITEVQEPPPVPPKETLSVPFKISEVIAAKEPMMLRKMVQLDDGLVSVVSIGGQVDDNLDDDESGPLSAHQPPMSPPSDTVDHDNSSQVPAPYLKQQQDKSIQEVQPEPAPQASNLERFLKSKTSSSPTKRHSLAPTDIQRSSSASSIEQPTNKSRHSYIPSSLVPRSLSLTPNNRSLSRLSTISSTSTMSNRSSVISLSGPSEFGKAWWLAQPSEEDVSYSIVVRVGLKRSFRKGGARVNLTVEVPVTVV
ncbi:hypothetical protein BCR33DRAFT_720449 [Rhizoclosmatium globosum]|uniref:Uncharacterized protein n=1 Tax=Rhizoclosmatium globosum TaxID=329046 RepID=A0A1Y2BVW2_9FUNG|nr:hypothetical protein BCR33DRAFT_720449 [Rhizoclosmatium globosum]|eukprot:ORY38767.1 hypothetical protein BCR33DRAFT_720449 [Rhizoclosmatium globosum]